MRDLGRLILRLTLGGLMVGHGSQKLFGAFEGHGLQGTGQWLESMGLRPGSRWALAAGFGEFGGGVLTVLGLMHPVGPIATIAPMGVAWGRVHWGKPIWVTSGGAELPATNIAIALALALVPPGRFSIDRLLGIKPHPALALLVGACVAAGTVLALNQPTPEPSHQQQAAEQPEAAAAT
jgi:putative oxidoreductase